MNTQNQYSDEHINAYIDGELDVDERARLLYDEQQDDLLAKRINDARILKEKVQLAYSDLTLKQSGKYATTCSTFANQHRLLVAGFSILFIAVALLLPALMNNNDIALAKQLIKNTPIISASAIEENIGTHKKIVINLSQYQPDIFDDTLNNIEKLLLQKRNDKSFNIEIVAHGKGLKALDTDTSAHAQRITLLTYKFDNLKLVACAKSLADLATSGQPVKLMKSIMLTPSAAEQIAKRTGEGWLYLKL